MEEKKKHSSLGKASLIIGIIGIVGIVVVLSSIFIDGFGTIFLVSIFSYALFIFALLAIILGAIAFFGSEKDTYGLIAFIIGICLFIAAPISIAASTYFYVSDMIGGPEPAPSIIFQKSEHDLTVVSVDLNVFWSELSIDGNYSEIPSHPYVLAGDKIVNCSGTITIIYTPLNIILGSWTFD